MFLIEKGTAWFLLRYPILRLIDEINVLFIIKGFLTGNAVRLTYGNFIGSSIVLLSVHCGSVCRCAVHALLHQSGGMSGEALGVCEAQVPKICNVSRVLNLTCL